MQVQITTSTTETMKACGENFQITTFQQTTTAFCDCCANSAAGTKDELQRRGWGFASGAEFCPDCN